MKPTASHYMTFLKLSRERMLRFSRGEQFMEWAVRSLFIHIKPRHVSIALYNPQNHTYCIRHSAGHKKFPTGFIALSQTSPIVQNFSRHHGPEEAESENVTLPICQQDFLESKDEMSIAVLEEMKRHRVEVCAKIDACDRLEGYLLVGAKEDGSPYREEDMLYFQTLAYDIAIEIEKDRFYQSSHVDPLTGVLNRYAMESRFPDILKKCHETHHEVAVAMMDVDNFKQINDRYGHLAGDQVLKAVAEIFRSGLRQSDPIFRFGGEEFMIVLHKTARNPTKEISSDEFRGIAFKILDNLRNRIASRSIECSNAIIPVTLSIGLNFYDGKHFKTGNEIIAEADKALYAAKQTGKNKVLIFNPAWVSTNVAA